MKQKLLIQLVVLVMVALNISPVRAQELPEDNQAYRLYLPGVSGDLSAPTDQIDQEGSWRRGVKIHREFYDGGFHFTLEVDALESETCSELQMWNVVRRRYDSVNDGHWRNYEGWGPQYWQLTKTWIATHLLEALRPGNYWAWCKP